MISLDDALACYQDHAIRLQSETVAIHAALGRVLAEPAAARIDLPAFAQAAVDGYALRCTDTKTATHTNPIALKINGEVAAGMDGQAAAVQPGTCVRIFTGAPLPASCDAVIRQEETTRDGANILLSDPVALGTDMRERADELQKGQQLGRAGQHISSGLLAALAMAGVSHVEVYRRPRITVLITGDEVVPAGQKLRAGEIYDANGPLVSGWLRERGYPTPAMHYVRDDAAGVETALEVALSNADLVITTGGVSVGDRDYVPGVAEKIGATPLFWKVAQKPGKPLYFARRDNHLLMGLPGNPAAVLIGLVMHAARVLDHLEGIESPRPALYAGRLTAPLHADSKRERLVRARCETTVDGVRLSPLRKQASHMLSNLQAADVLIRVPPATQPYPAETLLYWTPL